MVLPSLTAPLLYALLSLNPAAVSSLAATPTSTNAASRQVVPRQTSDLVNANVSCREGEFQNPDSDIVSIVCGDYYQCAGGTEAERIDPDGEGGSLAVFTAQCLDCRAGQPPDKASGCTYTPI